MSMSASRHAWVSLRRSSLPRQRWFIIVLALLGGCALAMNTIVAGHVVTRLTPLTRARDSTMLLLTVRGVGLVARLTRQLAGR